MGKIKFFKACILCLWNFTTQKHFKNYEKCFFKDVHFFLICSFPFHISRFKELDETGIIMMLWIVLHKLASVNFEITQKPLQDLSKNVLETFSKKGDW